MSLRRATAWSLVYVSAAVLFGVVLGATAGWSEAEQFLAGYAVEKSLSIDNLFVFATIMSSFAVPAGLRPRALTLGIALALVLRGVFIAAGAALIAALSVTFLVFGIMLIVVAVQLFRHRDLDPSPDDNVVVALARRRLPLTDDWAGTRLVVRRGGRRLATPLALVLLAIGTTDLLFALDSIPAVYGVTDEPLIVLAANVFALLGMRPLFFLVTGLLDRLVHLAAGLAAILLFIGVKLVLHFAHDLDGAVPEPSTGLSLVIVLAILCITTVASVASARRQPSRRGHAGALRAPDEPNAVSAP